MIRETELNLFVPSPELLVRLASGDRPLGIRAGPPRIKALRETFFDTEDQTLRRRGMTCKLRQVEGEEPSIVVTVGEDPDSEGITVRSRLTAAAIGAGVFETLSGNSEPATQVQKFVDPARLRPQLALDIQRLGRVFRGGLLLKPVLLLFFDRITVQMGSTSSVFHEISVRRRREGGPLIRDLARQLRDEHHLFPDGLSRLHRAYRVLAVEKKVSGPGLSPYGLNLALAVFSNGKLALLEKDSDLHIPTFRGSGEDAARALAADLTGDSGLPLLRVGTTEPREGRAVAELWTIPDQGMAPEMASSHPQIRWMPWYTLLERVGRAGLRDPTLVSTLLLLTRKKLLGQLPWIDSEVPVPGVGVVETGTTPEAGTGEAAPVPGSGAEEAAPVSGSQLETEWAAELHRVAELYPVLKQVENKEAGLRVRLQATSRLAAALDRIFFQDVTRAKGRILSGVQGEGEETPILLVDLMSIRIRGIVDRTYRCLETDLLPQLEEQGVHIRTWAGLMHGDRRTLLEQFTNLFLPSLQVAREWGPSFIPEMPLAGSAIGLMARFPGADGTRFFHVVLRKEPPTLLPVPGTAMVLPLEEVIRGYFLSQVPELERAEVYMFRFTNGAATVREPKPYPDPVPGNEEGFVQGELMEQGSDAPLVPQIEESRQSVVVRVLAPRKMPEAYQAQLLRALERQVSRRNPLIGWSDLYPVPGALELSGLDQLLDLEEV